MHWRHGNNIHALGGRDNPLPTWAIWENITLVALASIYYTFSMGIAIILSDCVGNMITGCTVLQKRAALASFPGPRRLGPGNEARAAGSKSLSLASSSQASSSFQECSCLVSSTGRKCART